MIAKTQFPDIANAKLALPSLLMTLNPFVSGMILASILAAVLSTASPIFLSCGTLITRDLYMEFHKSDQKDSEKKLLLISRLATFFAGIICIIAAVILSRSTAILDIVYFAYSLRGSLFIILLLGIFWKDMNQAGAITGMAATAVLGAFWVIYKKAFGAYPIPALSETYIAVITSFVVSVAVSLLTNRRTKNEKVNS
jgi:SSS family solute:Na+ symporter